MMGVRVAVKTALVLLLGIHAITALPLPDKPATFDNATMDLSPNGVPVFEVIFMEPTYEEMERFGTEDEVESMELILEQNAQMTSGVENLMFEGDVLLGFNVNEYNVTRPLETAARNRNRRWPNGVVPYFIDNSFDSGARGRILNAIQRYHQTTCLRFVPRTNQRDYVHIVPRQGCFSAVGRQGGRQELSVGGTCTFSRGTIMHELMHAVGFQHEQTRTDRDQFVIVYFQNIIPGLEYNFQRYSANFIDNLQTQYDYASIMHYPRNAFSRNGQPTILPRQAGVSIGNRNDFSSIDRFKLNRYYECEGTTGGGTGTRPEADCRDNNVNCQYWASIGECQRNPRYMNVNCRRSCRICGAGNTITTPASVCMDMHERCREWANRGECQANPRWMLPNCEQSCNQCTQRSDACMDLNENCDMWALNGECDINSEYMTVYCQLSCGMCGATNGTNESGDGSVDLPNGVDTIRLPIAYLLLQAVVVYAAFLKQ